ncbi:hypothetical protein ACFLSQ_03015 [Bacteroidota bacterium]
MKERNIVLITLAALISVAFYWIWSENKPVDFVIEEVFADSTVNGKIYFGFVAVDKYDEEEMDEYGRNFLTKQVTLDVIRKDVPVIAVVHYYDLGDTVELTDELKANIKRNYPQMNEVQENLQCVKKGYIYTGFSKKIEGLNMPRDTLFETTVIIPRNGIKAQDVLKITNQNTLKTDAAADSTDSNNHDSLEVEESGSN